MKKILKFTWISFFFFNQLLLLLLLLLLILLLRPTTITVDTSVVHGLPMNGARIFGGRRADRISLQLMNMKREPQ